MTKKNKYLFSFTASSLRLNEMVRVARSTLANEPIDYAVEVGNSKEATGKRILIEIERRIKHLTKGQLFILANSDVVNQKQVAFLAICKTYGFIRDFVVEVLREKTIVFDYKIYDGEYITFFRNKAEAFSEMNDLTEGTQKKIRQVAFTILEQAGIIDSVKSKTIQPQILDPIFIKSIIEDDVQWLKVFLWSDLDIMNLNVNI